MGGNHKKNLRAEKAKVKLKGAKLPKGLNITKTEFKVRKIQIREQLKDSSGQQQDGKGQRQLNLKEILNRLKHYGANFRLEALRNLRAAILSGHDSLSAQMYEIIQGILAISLDIEKEPRRESFNTLKALLSALSVEEVAPFFHIISSYLRCAMTHIQPNIQEDSLLLLDVLLERVPQLVAEESGKILIDFLQMISRLRAEGKTSRILTLNMGEHQTTIKWRTKVLQRLQLMLSKQHETLQAISGSDSKVATHLTRTFNVKAPQHFPLKRSYDEPDIGDLFSLTTQSSANSSNHIHDSTSIRFGAEHLMPLLLEAWLEVRPQENSNKSDNNKAIGAQLLLSHDAALTLHTVLDIIGNLWSLIDLHERNERNAELSAWFRKEYAEAFAKNFLHLSAFPYQQSEITTASDLKKKAKKQKLSSEEAHCLHQNTTLIYLMSRFFGNRIDTKTGKYFNVLLEYLNKIVSSLREHASEYQNILVIALRAQLLQNGESLLRIMPEKVRQLLRSTIETFLRKDFIGRAHNSMLITLCDIVQKPDLMNAYGVEEFGKFLHFLPHLLLHPSITEDALLSMALLSKQRNEQFLQSLARITKEVIENITKIQVHGAVNAFEGKKHIMNLFFWAEKPRDDVEELCAKIATNISDKRISSYFQFVLSQQYL